ncbi:carbonic anhydrase [Stachybotrys elegans]|uniref:Carbonic anhydrase n=1 Tax=Stachybotrys elegans TaxID=80388 RepID=A0A8K0WMD3_9HYPO|nr:carbonic anhydrase [Stachybotrys elegans]
MSGPTIQELLDRNERLSTWFRPAKFFSEISTPRSPKILMVSCLDPRSQPEEIFGLQFAEALSFRNLGGRVASVHDDIVGLDSLLRFEHVIIIHHTDCALLHYTSDQVREGVRKLPGVTAEEAESLVLPNFSSLEDSVREDMEHLKKSKVIRPELKEAIKGFVFDIKTGLIKQVE